ncbi:uncharacterized protein LOC116307914 [Actinia tenebrosa]|uniref:Uncharacterized protein LOC116307914 n=1 Tax=Actinia tenebrosa TaxID=6105 RepID=A0A6P8JBS3_ACTTE|nr:uncharacterized protein LOC116307914 [Actinia tenebrosa]
MMLLYKMIAILLCLVTSMAYASMESCSEPIQPATLNTINPTASYNTLMTTLVTSPCKPRGTQGPPRTDMLKRKIPRSRGSRIRVDPYILVGVGIAVGIALVIIAIIFVWRRRQNRYQNFDRNATPGVTLQDTNNNNSNDNNSNLQPNPAF